MRPRPSTIPKDLFAKSVRAMNEGKLRNPYAHWDKKGPNPHKCKCNTARHKITQCADCYYECEKETISKTQVAKEKVAKKEAQEEDCLKMSEPVNGNGIVTHPTLGTGKLLEIRSNHALVHFECDPNKRNVIVPCLKLKELKEQHAIRLHGCSVTIDWLLAFTFDHDCWEKATWWVNRHIIKEATRGVRCRYMHLPEMKKYARKGTVFASHCWGSKWGDVVLALAHGARGDRAVWVDLFAVRQWTGSDADLNFRDVIGRCDAMIVSCSPIEGLKEFIASPDDRDVFLNTPEGKAAMKRIPTFRLWCNVEISEGVNRNLPVIVKGGQAVMKQEEHKDDDGSETLMKYVYDIDSTGSLMDNLAYMIDVANSECEVDADKEREMKIVRAMDGGIQHINDIVAGVVNGATYTIGFNVPEVDAYMCGEPESFRRLNLHVGATGEQKSLASVVLAAAGAGGRLEIVKELLYQWSNVDTHDEVAFIEKDGRIHFVCTHETGVGCRNSPQLDDRCDLEIGVCNKHDFIAGTLSQDDKWIHIVESNDQQMIGMYLPLSVPTLDEILFDKITSNIEWTKKQRQNKENWVQEVIDESSVLCSASSGGHVEVVNLLLGVTNVNVNVGSSTALYNACFNGHLAVVQTLLAQKTIDVNKAEPEHDRSPLHIAITNGHHKIVQALLERTDINVNQQGNQGWPPLMNAFASDELHFETVQKLLARSEINVNQTCDSGFTALLAGCMNGHFQLVNALLEREDIDVNTSNEDQVTPLFMAINAGHDKIARILLHRKDIDISCMHVQAEKADELLPFCCQNGYLKLVQNILQRKDIDVNQTAQQKNCDTDSGCTPLSYASQHNHVEVVYALLAHVDIDVNKQDEDGKDPLSTACAMGHVEIVRALLATNRIEINTTDGDGRTPLFLASVMGRLDVVQALLERKIIDVNQSNSDGLTPLFMACSGGHLQVIQALLERKDINVDYKKEEGVTPLHFACQFGHLEIAQALLTSQHHIIDMNLPFLMACQTGQNEIVQLLLKQIDIDVDHSMFEEVTPLYYACLGEHLEVVRTLLDNKRLDVNRGHVGDGSTPLHMACEKGNIDVARALLDMPGIDVNKARMEDKVTPLHVACNKGHTNIVRLLLAQPNIDLNKKALEKSALAWATIKQHGEIVQLLDDAGATPYIPFSRGDKDQVGVRTETICANGHGLIRFETPRMFGCDLCENGIPEGSVMYGCDECDYDVCSACETKPNMNSNTETKMKMKSDNEQ